MSRSAVGLGAPAGAAATLAVLVWRAGHRPVPRRPPRGRRPGAGWPRAAIGAADHGLLRLAVDARRPRPRRPPVPARAPSRRTTARSSSTSTLPGGVLGDVHRGVRHGRDVGDVGRGLRAVAWERAAGQVVQVVLAVAVLLVAAVAACAPADAARSRRRSSRRSLGRRAVCAGAAGAAGRPAGRGLARAVAPATSATGCSAAGRGRSSRSPRSWSSSATLATFLLAARTAGVDAPPCRAAAAGAARAAGDGGAAQRRRLGAARGRRGVGVRRRRAGRRPQGVADRRRLRRPGRSSPACPARVLVVAGCAAPRGPGPTPRRAGVHGRRCSRGRSAPMADRPYTLLSCGMSIDGYLDGATDAAGCCCPTTPTSTGSTPCAPRCDAILVGAGTVRQRQPAAAGALADPARRAGGPRAARRRRSRSPSPGAAELDAARRLLRRRRRREARLLREPGAWPTPARGSAPSRPSSTAASRCELRRVSEDLARPRRASG